MGGHCLKVYRMTKMAPGKDDFLYEYDLDAVLPIFDADTFENDEDIESDIVTCFKNLLPGKIAPSSTSFVQTFVYTKQIYQGTRKH